MFHRFRYEAEYYPNLSRLPIDVRMKLDVTGIKISLNDWLSFSFAERTVLCHLPCSSEEEKAVFTPHPFRLGRADQAATLPRDARRAVGKPQRTALRLEYSQSRRVRRLLARSVRFARQRARRRAPVHVAA